MSYSVKDALIKGLVAVLKPPKKSDKPEKSNSNLNNKSKMRFCDIYLFFYKGDENESNNALVVHVQQAAAAKTIGILVKNSFQTAELFLSVFIL